MPGFLVRFLQRKATKKEVTDRGGDPNDLKDTTNPAIFRQYLTEDVPREELYEALAFAQENDYGDIAEDIQFAIDDSERDKRAYGVVQQQMKKLPEDVVRKVGSYLGGVRQGLRVEPHQTEDGVTIYISSMDGPDVHSELYEALRNGTLGQFLDGLREGRKISFIVDEDSEKHPDFIDWMFRGDDTLGTQFQGPNYINPEKQKSRIGLFERLTPQAQLRMARILRPHIRKAMRRHFEKFENTKNMLLALKDSSLPTDVKRNIASFLGGTRKHKKNRKSRKSRRRV